MNGLITTTLQVKESTGEHIAKLFQGLFPAWPTILATLLAFIVLITVMYKLVWHPVRKMVKDRHDFIQKNIDESILNFEDAKAQREKAYNALTDSHRAAKDHLENVRLEAEAARIKIIEEAKKRANKMIASANTEIAAEKINMQKELRIDTVDLALAAAKKVIEKEVDTQTNRKLIKEFIKSEIGNK